jgi:hypothetical protein
LLSADNLLSSEMKRDRAVGVIHSRGNCSVRDRLQGKIPENTKGISEPVTAHR